MRASPENCFHLSVEIVREIHAQAIARFGGSDGVRDSALLESAVAAPQASFGGESPYRDLAEVSRAVAYGQVALTCGAFASQERIPCTRKARPIKPKPMPKYQKGLRRVRTDTAETAIATWNRVTPRAKIT